MDNTDLGIVLSGDGTLQEDLPDKPHYRESKNGVSKGYDDKMI